MTVGLGLGNTQKNGKVPKRKRFYINLAPYQAVIPQKYGLDRFSPCLEKRFIAIISITEF
jgi:hypothetical protein